MKKNVKTLIDFVLNKTEVNIQTRSNNSENKQKNTWKNFTKYRKKLTEITIISAERFTYFNRKPSYKNVQHGFNTFSNSKKTEVFRCKLYYYLLSVF